MPGREEDWIVVAELTRQFPNVWCPVCEQVHPILLVEKAAKNHAAAVDLLCSQCWTGRRYLACQPPRNRRGLRPMTGHFATSQRKLRELVDCIRSELSFLARQTRVRQHDPAQS